MVSHKETFSKPERLCSKKAMAGLFKNGESFFCFPFQVIWLISPSEIPFPSQVAFSVTKKDFKIAIKRNLIKRRIKEAYRKNKNILYSFLNSRNLRIIFIIIYKNNKIADYAFIEKSVKEIIAILISKLTDFQKKC